MSTTRSTDIHVGTRISKETFEALTKKKIRIERETGTETTISAMIRKAIERDVAKEKR